MSVGRNDPCPCGSGKKHKRCCLERDEDAARPAAGERGDGPRERILEALDRWILRPEQREMREEALASFCRGAPPDEVVDDDDGDRLMGYVCFDHLFDGRPATDLFLETAGRRLDDDERWALGRLAAARLRVYQVTEVVREEGLHLRDLWSDERLFVSERLATRQLHAWDLLAARVTRFENGRRELDGGNYLFGTDLKADLVSLLRRAERAFRKKRPDLSDDVFWRLTPPLIHEFWLDRVVHRPPPTIVTAEGDLLELGKVVFDVRDEARLRAALDAHPDLLPGDGDWAWVEETGTFTRTLGGLRIEGRRLILEVTSRRRGRDGRRLVLEAAGAAVAHRSTRYETVERALARREEVNTDDAAGRPAEPMPEEATQIVAELKDAHYRTWPDTPLPALGGRTPRHAARLKTIRPKLVDLLAAMENAEARSARPGSPPYDFGWLWRELGLKRPM
jgi:hypothetical protein